MYLPQLVDVNCLLATPTGESYTASHTSTTISPVRIHTAVIILQLNCIFLHAIYSPVGKAVRMVELSFTDDFF